MAAEHTGKPIERVFVRVDKSEAMFFGNSTDPCCVARVVNIGPHFDETVKNDDFGAKMSKLIEEHLSVPAQRIMIELVKQDPNLFCINGMTVATKNAKAAL